MSQAAFATKVLEKENRRDFNCGEEVLNQYFRERITQDVRRRIATAFIAQSTDTKKPSGRIAGFYTLSACHVLLDGLDDDWRSRLPRYPNVPSVLIGRLAIDSRYQGRGLGGALLVDAASRASRSSIGVHMLVVEAKNDAAIAFYQHHGLRQCLNEQNRLFIPLSTFANQK